jgi:uncharacterized protein (DUF2147 family)
MKPVIFFLLMAFSFTGFAQDKADAIIGKWLKTPKNDLIIQVYKDGDEYKGTIAWSKDNDPKKPLNYLILEELTYDPRKKIWTDGKIHDPNSGKSYDAEVKLTADGSLEVLGYLGFKFLGTTKYFSRVK